MPERAAGDNSKLEFPSVTGSKETFGTWTMTATFSNESLFGIY